MDNGGKMDGKKLNVTITPEDQVLCIECGCGDFYQPIYIYKVASPLIGARPIVTIQPNTSSLIMCAGCMSPLAPDTLTTKAELDKKGMVQEGDAMLKQRANTEALRIMKTIMHATKELGVTPEVFADLMDEASLRVKEEFQQSPQGVLV